MNALQAVGVDRRDSSGGVHFPFQGLLSAVAWLVSAGVALAQDGEGILTVGNAGAGTPGTYTVPTGGDAACIIELALDRLDPGGGEVVLLPGDYVFASPVDVSGNGVTIRGSRGVHCRPAPLSTTGLFHVVGDAFLLAGVSLIDDRQRTVEDRSPLVQIQGSEATLRDLFVRVDHRPKDGSEFVAVEVSSSSCAPFLGVSFLGNSFFFGASSETDPTGLLGVRLANGRGARFVGNEFRGEATVGGDVRYVIQTDDVWFATVEANNFVDIGRTGIAGTALIYIVDSDQEGHHTVVAHNTLENCRTRAAVEFNGGHGFHDVQGNVFRRCKAGVLLSGGDNYIVAGNVFQEMDPEPGLGVVHCSGTSTVTRGIQIVGNQFRLATTSTQVRAIDCGDCKIIGNQFLALVPNPMDPVVLSGISPTNDGNWVFGNSATGYGTLTGNAVWTNGRVFLDAVGVQRNNFQEN